MLWILMNCLMHLSIGMWASHLRECRTNQVQLHMVVAISRAITGMEALVEDMMMIVTKAKMTINLEKKNLRNSFPSLIMELLLKGKHLIIAGKLLKSYSVHVYLSFSFYIFYPMSSQKFCFACN